MHGRRRQPPVCDRPGHAGARRPGALAADAAQGGAGAEGAGGGRGAAGRAAEGGGRRERVGVAGRVDPPLPGAGGGLHRGGRPSDPVDEAQAGRRGQGLRRRHRGAVPQEAVSGRWWSRRQGPPHRSEAAPWYCRFWARCAVGRTSED
ncbi:hypothetical protein SBRY_10076 [Actinacidiphila bryophytorum]|uniref:Uncharacterized protein n=1 Tax=Actinacidiphila bryophytorum TaxID=1436133 RepID=A0A9W4E561_9ACTN|nr:hypothetical protein SBRY_10076 [Actinacidiphila bryophytorum]